MICGAICCCSIVWKVAAFFCLFFLHLFTQYTEYEKNEDDEYDSHLDSITRLKVKVSSWKLTTPRFRDVS